MRKLWTKMRANIFDAVRNTPVEVALAALLATVMSCSIADVGLESQDVARLFLTSFLALCAIFATSAANALRVFDGRTRWLLTTAFGGGLAAYGVEVLNTELATEAWRWAFLAVAAVMGVMLVPVAARMGEVSASERFWRYNIRLFSRIGVAWAYALALYAGVALGVAAIDGLFELSINDDIYGHLFAWIVIGLGTVLAVGGLGEIKRIGEPFTPESLLWGGRLGTFLFIPLVLLYLAIMYAYLAKVLVTGVIPSNILSPLALGAGILGYFGLFVLQPHMHREDFKPLAAVLRAFPAAFVPIVPFGIWAVWQRVAQYGWTEFRYARMAALVCLGIFSLVGAVKWLRKQEFSLVTGPAILGVLAILGAVGPWGGSYVSQASQLQRLEHALRQSELLGSDGRILPKDIVQARDLEPEQGTTIRETLDYLIDDHGFESVQHLSPVDLSAYEHTWERLDALGVSNIATTISYTFHAPYQRPYHFERGGLTTEFSLSSHSRNTHRGVALELKGEELIASHESVTGRLDVMEALPEQTMDTSVEFTPAQMMRLLHDDDGNIVGEVGLRDVTVERRDGSLVPTYVGGIVVLYER